MQRRPPLHLPQASLTFFETLSPYPWR